jgi:ketosteroid isomerase-like protein
MGLFPHLAAPAARRIPSPNPTPIAMTHLEKAQRLCTMMNEGKTMEAFEELYHPDVVVEEVPTGEKRQGKEAQRQAIQQWYGMVKEFHAGGVDAITANEDEGVTTVESWMDVTFQDGNRARMAEVAVQRWQDGQIINEKFYYHMPPRA